MQRSPRARGDSPLQPWICAAQSSPWGVSPAQTASARLRHLLLPCWAMGCTLLQVQVLFLAHGPTPSSQQPFPISSLPQLHLSGASIAKGQLIAVQMFVYLSNICIYSFQKEGQSCNSLTWSWAWRDLGQRNVRDEGVHVVLIEMGFISPAWFRHSSVWHNSGFFTWSCGTHRRELQAPMSVWEAPGAVIEWCQTRAVQPTGHNWSLILNDNGV